MAAHAHDQLWAAGVAAHAPPPSKGLLFRLVCRQGLSGGQYPENRTLNGAEYETRLQEILTPGEMAKAEKVRGDRHQAPLKQWPGQGDGLPPQAIMQGALGLQGQQPAARKENA